MAGELDLEAGDTLARARWRSDLGGKVGKGSEIVARERGGAGELAARDLHAIARVAGEPDHDVIARLE